MKIPTETEIKAMNNTDSRTMYHSLEKEYKIKFEKEYIPEPGGEQVTLEDELISLAKHLREGKPSPWIMEDWKDVD